METPAFAGAATGGDLAVQLPSGYLPSLGDIDHIAADSVVYSDDELDELDRDLGIQPRKRAKRTVPRRDTLPPALAKQMGDANMLFVTQDLQGAAQLLLEIIREAPHVASPYHTLGLIYEQLGHQQQALQVFVLAAHFTPRDVDMWRRLAMMAEELEETDLAVHCLTRLLRMESNDTEALRHRTMLYERAGNVKRALEGYRLLYQKVPDDPDVVKRYCHCLFTVGKCHNAVRILNEYVESARKRLPSQDAAGDDARAAVWDFTVINMLCELLMQMKDFKSALSLIDETISLKITLYLPIELTIRRGLCQLCCEAPDANDDDRADTEACISRIFDLDPGEYAALYIDVGDMYYYMEMPDKALAVLSCLETVPEYDNADLWIRLARCYKDLPDGDEQALRYAESVVEEHPSDIESRMIMSEVFRERGDSDKAIAALKGVDEEQQFDHGSPDEHVTHRRGMTLPIDMTSLSMMHQAAKLCFDERRYDDVVSACYDRLSRTLNAVVSRRDFRLEKRAAATGSGDAKQVHMRIRSIPPLLLDPLFLETLTILCSSLALVGRVDHASTLLKQTLRFEWPPLSFWANALRCVAVDVFMHRGDYARACSQATVFLIDGQDPRPAIAFLNLIQRMGYPERYRRYLERALVKWPSCAVLRAAHAHYFVMKKTYGRAVRGYLRALEVSPDPCNDHLVLFTGLAFLHRAMSPSVANRHYYVMRAFEMLFEYKKRKPNAAHPVYNLARAFHTIGINHLAERLYKETLSLSSKLSRPARRADREACVDMMFPLSSTRPAASEAKVARAAAFNLSLLYRRSGRLELASSLLHQYICF